MIKYSSNVQYENDKANFINLFGKSITINNRTLADLLNQSKWIGLQNAPQKSPYKKPEFLKDARSSNNETES